MNHIITEIDLDDVKECPICMNEFKLNESTAITSCGHIYHNDCLNKWVAKIKKNKCPICRENYNKTFFDKKTIVKWTEKGKALDISDNFLEKFSVKTISKIVKSLYLECKGCYDKNDFLQVYNEHIKKITLKQIITFLSVNNIDYSTIKEKDQLLKLYQIYILRSCGKF